MFNFLRESGRGALLLTAMVAIGAAGCGSSSTPGSGAATAAGPNGGSGAVVGPAGTAGLSGAAAKLAGVTSYKFSLTLLGGDTSTTLANLLGTTDTPNAAATLTGTIVVKPAPAADMTLGDLHMIEIGGTDYLDQGGTGVFLPVPAKGLADVYSASQMFSTTIDETMTGDFGFVARENRDGVAADRYTATAAGLAKIAANAGVAGATWTADEWIAADGGYPVAMAVIGKAKGAVVYEVIVDVTRVDDPANTVVAPS